MLEPKRQTPVLSSFKVIQRLRGGWSQVEG